MRNVLNWDIISLLDFDLTYQKEQGLQKYTLEIFQFTKVLGIHGSIMCIKFLESNLASDDISGSESLN